MNQGQDVNVGTNYGVHHQYQAQCIIRDSNLAEIMIVLFLALHQTNHVTVTDSKVFSGNSSDLYISGAVHCRE